MTRVKRSPTKLPHDEYKKLCKEVMERDGFRCAVPGCKRREPLHVHHIIFRSSGGDDCSYNLLTLCDPCHRALHEPTHGRTFIIKPLVPGNIIDADEGVLFEFLCGWHPKKKTT